MEVKHLRATWLALALLTQCWLLGQQQPDPVQQFVGSETCLACHDLNPTFFGTAHALSECEGCHGFGGLHVESGGEDKSVSFVGKSANWAVDRCLSCHVRDADLSAFPASSHSDRGVSCLGCHQIHPEKPKMRLLRDKENALCSSCHPTVAADFRKPFHHPVLEGAMDCVDCHNPHVENSPAANRLTIGTESSCVSCHSDKAGPFVFEHGALRIDDCQTCHQPHGSINSKMLRRTQVHLLCMECHTATGGTVGNTPFSFHDLRSPRFRNCTTCHREIHGSNVSPAFLR